MTSEISYTVEEVANLLKVSKLTVYDLLKKGEIPSFKVGRQMRINSKDLDSFISGKKTEPPAETLPPSTSRKNQVNDTRTRNLLISGQDMVLDILGKHLEGKGNYKALRSYEGSLNSLLAMYKGECDIVSLHMFDGDTNEYNVPYVKKILIGYQYTIINLISRKAGFMVQKGNPLNITNWPDLNKNNIRLINREIGSGARILLEEQLRIHHLSSSDIEGYDRIETSHLSVASSISSGEADVGVGTEKAAKIVGLDFIPLITERYDLVMINNKENNEILNILSDVLNSASFKKEIQALGDYDISQTGQIIYKTS
ncbi:helix-turn-helix transcriptional regulator [Metabacillus halosaccharovorans]|uniref:helix-turn-helix transcriptional regulator n=1 Tax=Metabacillus halosaccharovorans TaxID=930124 RepID=UPI002041C1EE|nr:helix-turn-helix transcriptional regulator [Metabacillus halosaccharovorans]MCM3443450.1 helix-turn-helix transcriptional regulator [Metabacillus halosaccharovorans]